LRVVISAGGTGGHIYPALGIINKIKEMEPNSEFLYIGTHNRMEKDLIPACGIDYEAIKVIGFKRKISLENFKTLPLFLMARSKCKKIIKKFNPDVVIGVGGYVTAPVIYAAKKLGYKTFIHEQNSTIGWSNRYLSKYADKIGVCFEGLLKEFPHEKVVLTGNPAAEKALKAKEADKKEYGLSKNKKLVLFVMGSLGARTVNDVIVESLDSMAKKDYEVVFVTGNSYYEKIKDIKCSTNIKIVPYVYELPSLMKKTDLIVSRAGASIISEITALGIPAIFIPSPYVANNEQYYNALDLVKSNASLLIEEKDLTKETLLKTIDNVLENPSLYNDLKENVKKFGINDSSSRVYKVLKALIKEEKNGRNS